MRSMIVSLDFSIDIPHLKLLLLCEWLMVILFNWFSCAIVTVIVAVGVGISEPDQLHRHKKELNNCGCSEKVLSGIANKGFSTSKLPLRIICGEQIYDIFYNIFG